MSPFHHDTPLSKLQRHDRPLHRHRQHGQAPAEETPAIDIAALADDMILCHCQQVTVGQVKEAIASGAATVEQVMTLTDLGQACGCCVGNSWLIVQEFLAAK